MSRLFRLSERVPQHFPLAHEVPRVRRMAGGERDRVRDPRRASVEGHPEWSGYGPYKTLYNGFMRWSRLGVFNRIFAALAAEGLAPEQIMINTTHLKAHKTAAGGRQKATGACRLRN